MSLIPDLYDASPGIDVASWCPSSDGSGPATQVHLFFSTEFGIVKVRIKSARAIDELIDALIKHRVDVWGDPRGGGSR